MSHIRLAPEDISDHAPALLNLQHAVYAVGAALIRDDRIPALHETVEDLVTGQLHWVVDTEDDEIVGALGYDESGGVIEIDRLIVDPSQHRRGIGRRLVIQVLTPGRSATVSTGRDNHSARRLSETAGFTHLKDREVLPGLVVSDYALQSSTRVMR